jgi:hypothetical protein
VEVARTLQDLANAVGDLGDTNRKKQLLEEVLAILKDDKAIKLLAASHSP